MADLVRQSEERVAAYKQEITEKEERIKVSEQQLRAIQEASAKVDRNDPDEIHRRYAAVLSTLQEKKCSLNDAYRLAGTARSTIKDFLGIAEMKIVNKVTFQSTLQRLGNPKLAVRTIEQECRKQLGGLLPVVKRLLFFFFSSSRRSYCRWHWMMPSIRRGLRHQKNLAPLGATKFEKFNAQRNKMTVFKMKKIQKLEDGCRFRILNGKNVGNFHLMLSQDK